MTAKGLVFGMDLGISSCGWAVLRLPASDDLTGEIVAMGSWMFNAPETGAERIPTNQIRAANRLLRRVIRRRAQRMATIRRLFSEHGLLPSSSRDALKIAEIDPWEMRVKGLDKVLKPAELAVALGHIAKRRGFKSSAKRRGENTSGDDQKMLRALEGTRERLARYRTTGEMFARDPEFRDRKRNRNGVHDRTQGRKELAREVEMLFVAQRRLGNVLASERLEAAYVEAAFFQRGLQNSERLVGMCLFEPAEKRAAKFAPSFEKFRLLTRLINLRIGDETGERALTPDELAAACADLGRTAKLSAKAIRNRIGLRDDQFFTTIKRESEDGDIVARTGEAMFGTRKLRAALGEDLWPGLQARPEILDDIAYVLSFFETDDVIRDELHKLDLPAGTLKRLLDALPSFARFKGAGHISAKAVRALVPHLEAGLRYDQACERAGYVHSTSRWSKRGQVVDKKSFNQLVKDMGAEIANPIVRKALTEGLKQLWAMRNRWGRPDAVHIELAREVGSSLEERKKMENSRDKTTAQRKRERKEAAEQLGVEPGEISGDLLLRYRLWKEQAGRCPYTDIEIPPDAIAETGSRFQIDHILPWSRFADDSFNNRALCIASAIQEKRGSTPFEWIMRAKGEDGWKAFAGRIKTNKQYSGFKKRNLLLKNAQEVQGKFRGRNLNDTRYAARFFAEAAKLLFPAGQRQDRDGECRVFMRPGALIAALRHAWGVESLKTVDDKRIEDARHHALDALVVAAVSEGEIQRLTRSFQECEQKGHPRPMRRVVPPWGDFHNFRREVQAAYDAVFVARPARRRARGEAHAATIRQIGERDGLPVIYERKAVTDLGMDKGKFSREKALKQLENLKDLARNRATYDAVLEWIDAGRSPEILPMGLPVSKQPDSPRHPITKVTLATNKKSDVLVRGGAAERGDFVRIDVFTLPDKKGEDAFYLVPIYPHEIHLKEPPSCYLTTNGKEEKITPAHVFKMSIYNRSYVEIEKRDGRVLSGYVVSFDRSVAALKIKAHHTMEPIEKSSGVKTLKRFTKFSIDRFGNRHEVKSEVRIWRGEVCRSSVPPG